MRVENFRIGNYILHPECEPYYFKVEEIKDKYGRLGVVFRNGSCWDSEPEPIELTEEILLSIEGVNKKIVDNKGLELTIYTINNIELLFTFGILRNIKFMNNKVIIYTAFRDFKLHDLQNLYFVLNGKELEINL